MTWQKDLEIAIQRTKHDPLRFKCSDENPNVREREFFRTNVGMIAAGLPIPQPKMVPIPDRKNPERIVSPQPEQHVTISVGSGAVTRIPLAESIAITAERKSCPHFVAVSGCGCNRSRCMAGREGEIDKVKDDGSTLVSFWDCAACLRPDNQTYQERKYKKIQ